MANNFSNVLIEGRTVTNYVAKQPSGNDSNIGTSPDSPKATLQESSVTLIGAGDYNQNTILFNGAYQGDGKVILRNVTFRGTSANGFFGGCVNMTLINCTIDYDGGNARPRGLRNCIVKDSVGDIYMRRSSAIEYKRSIFINNTFEENTTNLAYQDSIFINCVLPDNALGNSAYNNYLDKNSIFIIYRGLIGAFIEYSNIQGIIRIKSDLFSDATSRDYAIQDQFTGTPQDNGYAAGVEWLSESQLTTDGYTGEITGMDAKIATCINRDPRFNNASLEDFTLQSDSPHIAKAFNGIDNIGGTQVALSTLVNDDGVGTIEVIPSPEIDTSITNSWKLNTGESEGFIDIIQRVSTESLVLGVINPLSALNFDSDFVGGTPQNNNVPDSEPLTVNYPRKLTTTSLAPDTTTVNVTGHDVQVGEFVRIAGEDREVTAVATDSFTVGSAFRAAVASGVTFQVGTENELAALRPNRLTYLLRTSNQTSKPTQDSEWDNDVDPIYGVAGDFLTQEWFIEPGYVIDGSNNVFGLGDSERDPALSSNQIACKWLQIRIYIRNNYES